MSTTRRAAIDSLLSATLLTVLFNSVSVAQGEQFEAVVHFQILDANGVIVPCRIHIKDGDNKPVFAPDFPKWNDHFVCTGELKLNLRPGKYRYEIERGPEHSRLAGKFEVTKNETEVVKRTLKRITTLRKRGWYSADLHVHRPVEDVEILMQAEDLDFAPVITWWNAQNPWKESQIPENLTRQFAGHRIYNVMAGEDEREGGALLYYGLEKPLDLSVRSREFPSPMKFVGEAMQRHSDVWIDIEKPFWWDVPVWLASGEMDSIGIANNHMCRSRMYRDEAWGRPRDTKRLPDPRGNGYWTQEIYYHMLNTGLRLPPSAGSASGVLPNPVGYNRVYVHLDEPFTSENWFEALKRGECFVTNGPLLEVTANGELSGTTFQVEDSPLLVKLNIKLTSLDRVPKLEVIQNGRVVQTIKCSEEVTQSFQIQLSLDKPGWFLVRAITDVPETFRFGSTAPWYVESSNGERRISKESATFFLNWTDERIDRVRANVQDLDQLRSILDWHEKARVFWTDRVSRANAD